MEEQRKKITVSRQMGSGGDYIGYEVAKTLGFSYANREILYRAASILNRSAASLEQYEEKSSGFIRNLLRTFAFGAPDAPYVPPMARPVYDKELFVIESKIMTEIVEKHDAVIIGRAGFHVFKDWPKAIHLFVHAPCEYRVKRVMKAHNIADVKEARVRVKESDRSRGKFIKDMTGSEWTDACNYHLGIDSSTADLTQIIEVVLSFIDKSLLQRKM